MALTSWENVKAGREFSERLKKLENIAEGELQNEESKQCIADVKALQSLTSSELIDRVQDHIQTVAGNKPPKSFLKPLVATMKSVNPFNYPLGGEESKAFFVLADMLSHRYKKDYKKYREKILPLTNALEKISAANAMKSIIKSIREIQFPLSSKKDIAVPEATFHLAYSACTLGEWSGIITTINKDQEDNNRYLEEIMHKIHCGRGGRLETRDPEKEQLYLEALAEADKLWKGGTDLWHDEMARALRKIKKYKDLSYQSLKERLIPSAKNYNKFYDSAKVKKRKLKTDTYLEEVVRQFLKEKESMKN